MSRVLAIIAAHNQKTLAAFNNDGTRTIWHTAEDGKSVALQLPQLPRQMSGLACSPDGKMVATRFYDGGGNKVRLWEVASQKDIATFDGYLANFAGDDFFPDSRTLATVTVEGVKLWDLATHRAGSALAGRFYFIAISPDGKSLATSDANNRVTLWDVATGRERASLRAPGGGRMVFSPDGSKVWVLRYQDPQAADPFYWLYYLFRRLGLRGFAFVSSTAGEEAAVFDATTGFECARVPSDDCHVLFADDKTLATFAQATGTIQLWDLPPRRAVHAILAWVSLGLALILTGTWWHDRRRCAAMPLEAVAPVH
jgi:WD40 repeat protein